MTSFTIAGQSFDLADIVEATPPDDAGHRIVGDVRFDGATFTDAADFRGVRFRDGVSFAHARFDAAADFDGAVFERASFEYARFGGACSFRGATFDAVDFRHAEFHGTAELTDLTIGTEADFYRALFHDTLRLSCRLSGELTFSNARFRGLTVLTITGADADAIHLDDMLCEGQLGAQLEAATITVDNSRLDRGGQLVVTRGDLTITGRMARPTLIAAASAPAARVPRLLSLAGADLSGTTLSGFDMTETRFARAHGLDGLRIDGRLMLRRAEGRLGTRRRLIIADEADARHGSPSGAPQTTFADVAAIYRDLRAGQEGRKDEPGSADFYYGEMEMRRRAARPLGAERAILETYRVVAGYGLRPSRSLGTLAALVLMATAAFHELLVHDPPRWLATLLFSLRSTVSFVREPRLAGMTLAAEYLQLGLRFAGPVLLALTFLAIRARVRR